jgi:hypothetical protein
MNGAIAMTIWPGDETDAISAAEEPKIATLRSDGTPRKPVTVWVVRHGPDLRVRSGYGNGAAWYRATQRRRAGRIEAGGIAKDVSFADADAALYDAIDAAYRAKYGHHGARWVDPMVSSEARSTTIKLVPR